MKHDDDLVRRREEAQRKRGRIEPRQARQLVVSEACEAQARRVASAPTLYRKMLEKSFTGGLSPRQTIKAKCLDCSNFQRDEVASCRAVACPLWALRPYQAQTGGRK
ncbi:hypothetical protein [Azohydromonas sediminis]|uniref:hypothetical protein n=1 Tax=Azohydromonas sediminis TaxID=2259674 RepID=UPI0013C36545|nr:hypothetical protein [Azohydromonas sediminis]